MNPVYSPGSSGVPYANAKGIGYPGKSRLFFFSFFFEINLSYIFLCNQEIVTYEWACMVICLRVFVLI